MHYKEYTETLNLQIVQTLQTSSEFASGYVFKYGIGFLSLVICII